MSEHPATGDRMSTYQTLADLADALGRALQVQRELFARLAAGQRITRAAAARNVAYIEAVLEGRTPEPWREPTR